ncbi:MAG: beta-ketoacyl-[acyl-carrier-protein] synthase family protein [Planctomycetaceae bacterium]|nr:beta-ketoacyl-[acyl-carrier-protein] synthase family protein [Planctomycetaceae bacterium]MCB9936961.1 beta-ketoacyl-[acyl-carrier-protein] synthase family protein [Planctomycetaceae bacterium]
MSDTSEIVITGIGVVSPIGIGVDAFWKSLREGTSGVRPYSVLQGTEMPVQFGGEVIDFDAKQYVTPRKSLKVMSREIQMGFAAAAMAAENAGIESGTIEPGRFGVVYGSEMLYGPPGELEEVMEGCKVDGKVDPALWSEQAAKKNFPLWMLKYLPNMTACHIGIAYDARGPSNSITHGDVSSLLAIFEGVHVIRRGRADVMIVGGFGARLSITQLQYRGDANLSHRGDDPTAASRPFDASRDGMVNGDGAGAIVIERREHAERRGAKVLATVRGMGESFEARMTPKPPTGIAIRRSIAQSLTSASLTADSIGHVSAYGIATIPDDPLEAQAIRDCLGDVPVTALKSYFGNLGSGGGAVEAVASVLALQQNEVPRTLNYETPDPACPVNVIHGESLKDAKPVAMVLSQAGPGQAAAMILSRD